MEMTKMKTNVLVTGTSGTNTGTQIMSALLMNPDRYRVVVTDIEEQSYGSFKAESAYVVPPASSSNYLTDILDICDMEKIQVVIPGSEPELKFISANRKPFMKRGIHLLINNAEVISISMDKTKTMEFLQKNGFPFPKYLTLDQNANIEDNLNAIRNQLSYPLIIKPYADSGGSNNVFIAQSKEETQFHLNSLKWFPNLKMMVQEYIGDPEDEYTIGVISDQQGHAFSSFVLKRLINTSFTRMRIVPNRNKRRIKNEYLTISSGVSQGRVGNFPEMHQFARRVADAIGSTGPLNIQCRKTDQGIFAFEINPRFSGTTSIRAICGHNDVDIMIGNRLFDESPRQHQYRKGLVLRSLENLFIEDQSI